MNFELKTLSLQQTSELAVDALVLLWPDSAAVDKHPLMAPLGLWAQDALDAKDLEEGVGQYLVAYKLAQAQAKRVVLVRCGDGSATQVKKAVIAAVGALKSATVKSLLVHAGVLAGAAKRS